MEAMAIYVLSPLLHTERRILYFWQAGAELGQDQVMLDDIVEVLVEFVVKVLVEVEV